MEATITPSLDEWKSLYSAAVEFRNIAPWQWMSDDMVFGVRNPETGETGYCSVLGALGEVFALNVYVGVRGLATYLDLALGSVDPSSLDVMYSQECLHASFEDRSELDERDHKVIKQLGLKFKGKSQWPMFRDYRPGYLPWYITSQQARFLTHALREAGGVALRLKANSDLLPKENNVFLVRAYEKDGGWTDKSLPADLPSPPVQMTSIPDEKALSRVKRIGVSKNTLWEVDLNFSPTVIQESPLQRPFYPMALVCMDSSGLAVGHHLFSHQVDPQEFQKRVLGVFQKTDIIPERVLIKREEVWALLTPIASSLGITIEMVDDLPAVNEFQEHLFSFLNRQ